MTVDWPKTLATRVTPMNNASVRSKNGAFVLAWARYALRAENNPLLDAATCLGQMLGKPVLVLHELAPNYPYPSRRLHRFLAEAARDMQRGCALRGLRMITDVQLSAAPSQRPVLQLADSASAVLTDEHLVRWARDDAANVAQRLPVALFGVDAACLVPVRSLPTGLSSTPAFRKVHGAERDVFEAEPVTKQPMAAMFDDPLPVVDANLSSLSDADLDEIVDRTDLDHSLPVAIDFPGCRSEAVSRLQQFVAADLPRYPWRRNNPADASGVSGLSPYLHFGLIGPGEITRAVREADTNSKAKWKFLDELLTWREWFHYQAYHNPDLDSFDSIPIAPRESLLRHADDPRPELLDWDALLMGETPDETWNAAQRQWLLTGYMHNNLRMYWGKQIIKWTPDPRTAWQVACYINDRLSLDGRDPATYGNMQWVFGASKPAWREQAIYGWVPPKTDRALRNREGFAAWAKDMVAKPCPDIAMPVKGVGMNEAAT